LLVVNDTSAITSLLKLRRIDILRDLFGEVLSPDER
jgi:predicted nucleic acid-binding protein